MKDELLILLKDEKSKELNIYRNKANNSFNKFLNLKNPNFSDGYKVWLKIQPYLWRRSLKSKLWK